MFEEVNTTCMHTAQLQFKKRLRGGLSVVRAETNHRKAGVDRGHFYEFKSKTRQIYQMDFRRGDELSEYPRDKSFQLLV